MCIGLFGEVVFFSVSAFGLFVCSFRVSARFLEPWCEVFGPSIRVQVYFSGSALYHSCCLRLRYEELFDFIRV